MATKLKTLLVNKMRNIYSKEFEKEMQTIASFKKINELLEIAIKKYNYNVTKHALRQYLRKRNIFYKDYNKHMAQDMGKLIPIGTEYVKDDGMTLIKIAPNKWMYKQRYIYSKYHNVELKSDDYIIFLDHNRNNFDINNLACISRHESAILSNQQLFSKNQEITKTGIQIAKLMIKLKAKENK